MQLDVFTCPLRLYQAQLHNNALNIGLDMKKVKLPKFENNVRADKWDIAQGAMDAVNRERIAKGQQPPNADNGEKTPMGAPESNQAGQPS
jgi:hypothetical protein